MNQECYINIIENNLPIPPKHIRILLFDIYTMMMRSLLALVCSGSYITITHHCWCHHRIVCTSLSTWPPSHPRWLIVVANVFSLLILPWLQLQQQKQQRWQWHTSNKILVGIVHAIVFWVVYACHVINGANDGGARDNYDYILTASSLQQPLVHKLLELVAATEKHVAAGA